MNRAASIVLTLLGIGLLVLGWDSYQSLSSGVSRLVTGRPTDEALLLLIGGAFALVAGLSGLTRGR